MSDIYKELPTLLPFSESYHFQNRFKECAKNIVPFNLFATYSKNNGYGLYPFMVKLKNSTKQPFKWYVYQVRENDVLYIDLTRYIDDYLKATLFEDKKVYCYYNGNEIKLNEDIIKLEPCYHYYYYFEFEGGYKLYSELFYVSNKIPNSYISLEFWNESDIGGIRYSNDFRQKIILDTFINTSSTEYTIETEEDGFGNSIEISKKATIKHSFTFIAPDFIKIALALLPFHKNVKLGYNIDNVNIVEGKPQSNTREGFIEKINVESETDEGGAINTLTISFESDVIINTNCNNTTKEENTDFWKGSNNFTFVYSVQTEESKIISLVGNIDAKNILIDWGDGNINSELTHTYNEYRDYIVKIKADNFNGINFEKVKFVTEIIKIPNTLTWYNIENNLFTNEKIKQLLNLINEKITPSIPRITDNNTVLDFRCQLLMGKQRNGLVINEENYKIILSMLQNNFFVDYRVNENTSSRYIQKENSLKIWYDTITFSSNMSKKFIFLNEDNNIDLINNVSGNNIDAYMLNYFCIAEGSIIKYCVLKYISSTYLIYKPTSKYMGSQFIGMMIKPSTNNPKINKLIGFNLVLDVISRNDLLVSYNRSDTLINNPLQPIINTDKLAIVFPFSLIPSNKGNFNTNTRPTSPNIYIITSSDNNANLAPKYFTAKTKEAGNYSIKIKAKFDFSNIFNRLVNPQNINLAMFYVNNSGNTVFINPSSGNLRINGYILDLDIIAYSNMPNDAMICFSFSLTIKQTNTKLTETIKVFQDSRVLIEKV